MSERSSTQLEVAAIPMTVPYIEMWWDPPCGTPENDQLPSLMTLPTEIRGLILQQYVNNLANSSGELIACHSDDLIRLLCDNGIFRVNKSMRMEALIALCQKLCLRICGPRSLRQIRAMLAGKDSQNRRLSSMIRTIHIIDPWSGTFCCIPRFADPPERQIDVIRWARSRVAQYAYQRMDMIDSNLVSSIIHESVFFENAHFAVVLPYQMLIPRNNIGSDEPTVTRRGPGWRLDYLVDKDRFMSRRPVMQLLQIQKTNQLTIMVKLGWQENALTAVVVERSRQRARSTIPPSVSQIGLDNLMSRLTADW